MPTNHVCERARRWCASAIAIPYPKSWLTTMGFRERIIGQRKPKAMAGASQAVPTRNTPTLTVERVGCSTTFSSALVAMRKARGVLTASETFTAVPKRSAWQLACATQCVRPYPPLNALEWLFATLHHSAPHGRIHLGSPVRASDKSTSQNVDSSRLLFLRAPAWCSTNTFQIQRL